MKKRYGVPHAMSKNRIAEQLVEFLPPAENFVDLFAGGCAVAHAALESGKYKHVFINDVDPMPTQMFMDAVAGKYKDERRVIDRDTFHKLRNSDPYAKYCWSYGAKGTTYIYGRNTEALKLAACRMIFDPKERTKFEEISDGMLDKEALDWALEPDEWSERLNRLTRYSTKYMDVNPRLWLLQRITPMHDLEYLISLESKKYEHQLARFCMDYRDVPIPENSVIYCDIPYAGLGVVKEMGMDGFNHTEFYEWAAKQENVFISSYEMPESKFDVVFEIARQKIMKKNSRNYAVEKIFTPKAA